MFLFAKKVEFDTSAKILFILKNRENSWGEYSGSGNFSSGLYNSANFAKEFLVSKGVDARLVHAIDNNCIDRLVNENKPTHVIIEAFWVVPEKFDILTKLHPKVKWIIRNHSNTPFLATEGIAFGWALQYLTKENLFLSCNHPKALDDMRALARAKFPEWSEAKVRQKVIFHPNIYTSEASQRTKEYVENGVLNVACFGAIRPLKNQMTQAVAAIEFCKKRGMKLKFHINATRTEGNGGPVLKNLRSTFSEIEGCELVEHGWLNHSDFLKLCSQMDIGLQVSYTETFNIVSADLVSQGTPIVTSNEVEWVHSACHADVNDARSIEAAMVNVLWYRGLTDRNLASLKEQSKKNSEFWKLWP